MFKDVYGYVFKDVSREIETHPECGWQHPIDWDPRKNKKES